MSVLTLHSQQIPSATWQFKSINGSQDGNQSCSLQTEYTNKYYSSAASHSSGIDVTLMRPQKIHSAGCRVHGKEILQLAGSDFQRHRSPLMSSGNAFCCVHVHYIANKYNSPSVSIDRISLQHVRLQSKQVPQ